MSDYHLVLLTVAMFVLLFAGFPMMLSLIVPAILAIVFFLPTVSITNTVVGQIIIGIRPLTLVCIPMFIFAAELMSRGRTAVRLVDFVKAWIGHIPGGLAISTALSCTLFGAVSGSAQATVVAIGTPLHDPLKKAGYPSSFIYGLIVASSGIALLIPPSLTAVIYAVAAKCSVGALFMAGVVTGVLVFLLFGIYCFFYAKLKKVGVSPKATLKERMKATRNSILALGFPLIILGGIFSGVFSPTEAAAAAVIYAIIVEAGIYRDLKMKEILEAALSAGVVTAVVFILIGMGQVFSFVLAYSGVPQMLIPRILGSNPSQLSLIILIMVTYFIACMFVDVIVAIYVLAPIFTPFVMKLGINPIFLGALVILQSAIGVATPPFGANIFTAIAIFRRPYFEVVRGLPWFIFLALIATALLIIYPEVVLILVKLTGLG